MNPTEAAIAYFDEGYACSQAILLGFGPALGLPEDLAEKIAVPFGGGISRHGETCGAVSGAAMVLGLRYGTGGGPNPEGKERVYQRVQEYFARFREQYGTTRCRELLGCDLGNADERRKAREMGVFKQCNGYIRTSAEILAQMLSAG